MPILRRRGAGPFLRPREQQPDPMGQENYTQQPIENDSGTMILEQSRDQLRIGEKEVAEAIQILRDYKDGKANLEKRIVDDELWYKLQHWSVMRPRPTETNPQDVRPEPASAWLFNAIANKHADASDNYPEPNVLPREMSDEQEAQTLSSVLPVILERNGFEETYSDNWWEKLKHGTGVYGVFWNPELENGLGDIDIRPIDLLNIFWEPGIKDIQRSRNLFIVDLWDTDLLEEKYPEHRGKLGGEVIDIKQYVHDDHIDTSKKSLVADRYYKVKAPDGRTVLHYMKFCNEVLLYASENDPQYANTGFYAHGKYPIVFDNLYPEKDTPVGFGMVAIAKDPQMYIDKLSQNIMEYAIKGAKPRFFVTGNTGVNEAEFNDWTKSIVHVEGASLDDTRLRQIGMETLSPVYLNVLQMKTEELKETSSNRDVNSGSTGGGVTAAAAIAALQEAGNKSSRDMISASYRAYVKIDYLCIELIRQFYTEQRTFRITGKTPGSYEFVSYSNSGLQDQLLPPAYAGQEMEPGYIPNYRRPVFDIKVRAEKRSPFSQLALNETAKELYSMGAFNADRAQEAMIMLDMMEFEGKDSIKEQVMQGQTLLNVCQQLSTQLDQMALIIQSLTGQDMGIAGTSGAAAPGTVGSAPSGQTIGAAAVNAQGRNMTAYGERLAKRAAVDMSHPTGE